MATVIVLLSAGVLIVLGVLESRELKKNLSEIPLRINVNGIRGKSTATRFITSILKDAGYKVVGKTTGTSARLLVWNRDREYVIRRRPIGPNIAEQLQVIKRTALLKADALVCECMAVKPEYQEIYQQKIIQANLVVITNVHEDHLDEMGPTTDQIALAFSKSIPYDGILVITEGKYANYFQREAKRRRTRVVCIDPESVEESYLKQFSYMVFKNNCAIGLGVARALGISDESAMSSMLKAAPDPGSTILYRGSWNEKKYCLVNAFAANEPKSSLEIWNEIQNMQIPAERLILILCCRSDRVDRSTQFAMDFLPYIWADRMLVIGTGTKIIIQNFRKGMYPNIAKCVNLTNKTADNIIAALEDDLDQSLIFCVGNIHGVAELFLEKFASIHI